MISLIFGIGNGLQTIISLSFLNSLTYLTLVSFLGIMKLGKPRSDLPVFTRTPSYTMIASSLLNCCFLWNATGYCLCQTGCESGFNSMCMLAVGWQPSCPSKTVLCFLNTSRSCCLSFEDSCTEEETAAGKAIFEGGFKFVASEVRRKFDITD